MPAARLVVLALAAIAFGVVIIQSPDRIQRILAAGLLCVAIALVLA